MKRQKVEELFINISLLLFASIAMARPYIDAFFGNKITLILYGTSIILVALVCISKKTIKNKTKKYPIFLLLFLLPSLFNNYYLKDGIYSLFFYYLITCLYFILLSYANVSKKNINFIINLFIFFAIATSIVTWISIIVPNFYTAHIIPLFPKVNRSEILYNFTYLKSRSGLCTHYSRNAFFMVVGILGLIYYYIDSRKKSNLLTIIFILISLFMVGKRAHFIFFIFSFIVTYFIFNKVNIKTVFKFICIFIIIGLLTSVAVKVNDEVGYVFERLMNYNSMDVSNGRYEMYKEIWTQYKNNGYMPLGWAEYASSTNYVHPGVHNDYIQLLCETGLLGFFITIGLNIIIFFNSIKYAHKSKTGISFIILLYNIFFMAYSLTGLPHYDIETYMYYFLVNYVLYHELFVKDEEMRIYG